MQYITVMYSVAALYKEELFMATNSASIRNCMKMYYFIQKLYTNIVYQLSRQYMCLCTFVYMIILL